MSASRHNRWIAASLALFTAAQTAFLAWAGALPARIAPEAWLVTGVFAFVLAQIWLLRHMLPAHTDMLVLMLAWGGFGMLLGWYLDGVLSAMAPDAGGAEMYVSATAPVQHADHGHHAEHGHRAITEPEASGSHPHDAHHGAGGGWFNAMNGLMLLFAFPPAILWARCLQGYRPYRPRLAWVLTLDTVGMVLGMMAGGRTLGHGLGEALGAPALGHHLGMLAGMTLGMYASMMLRRWLAPLPPSIASA